MSGPGDVLLRDVAQGDLPVFFEQQLDPESNRMAAFTAEDPADPEPFAARWARILGDETITKKTVVLNGEVSGHVLSFREAGRPEVSYWIGRRYWGRGLATEALSMFLPLVQGRPFYARAAKDNAASIRVLQKCGFAVCGEDRGFSNARGGEVEEFILRLGAQEAREVGKGEHT